MCLFFLQCYCLFGILSCSQTPETNTLKFISNSDRITKAWKLDNYRINGVDHTSMLATFAEAYTKQGAYSFQGAMDGGIGTWAFQNNNAEIRITNGSNLASRTLFILKLEDAAFWYYYMDGNDKKEFHFVKM